jgi:hypothetical protein
LVHSDDGTRADVTTIQQEICGDRANRVLVGQQATDGNYAFEYRNRRLLSHNHRGGITFTVETPQEAARCIDLGIYLNGRKHRVFAYTRSQADDLCTNCSTWGHQERTLYSLSHDVEYAVRGTGPHRHPNIRNGKNKFRCPNCSGNHQVHHSSSLGESCSCPKTRTSKG